MSNYRKYLFAILFLILGTSTANANGAWPYMFIIEGMESTWIIAGGLIIEIGFVKYFIKCSWLKTILVSIAMNLASAFLGSVALLIIGIGFRYFIYFVLKLDVNGFHWSYWLFYYMLCIIINTLIEGGVIKLILKLKFKDTYKWLAVANAISIIMCAIYVAIADVQPFFQY